MAELLWRMHGSNSPRGTPEAVAASVFDLERDLRTDPIRARQALRGVFADGRIVLDLQEDGTFLARRGVMPFLVPIATTKTQKPRNEFRGF